TLTGQERQLDATGVFVAIGHMPRTNMLAGQVDLDENGYIVVTSPSTATTLPGVFACGSSSSPRHPRPRPSRGCSRAGTPWTTPTARPSPPPAPGARPHWTPSATSPPSARPPSRTPTPPRPHKERSSRADARRVEDFP